MIDNNGRFDQEPSVGAVTTRQVLREGCPVLCVVHYSEDHSWAFLCGTTEDAKDGLLIGMHEILSLDPTLSSIADLPPGWCATRTAVGEPWKREVNGDDGEE